MIGINVQSNIERVRLEFSRLPQNIEEKATIRALNRAGDQSVTAASREIRREYNLSNAYVGRLIRVRNRAQRGRLFFEIRISGRRVPLVEFATGKSSMAGLVFRARRGSIRVASSGMRGGGGVYVKVKTQGGRKLIPRTFMATMPSGHVGVFARIHGKEGPDPTFRFGPGSGMKGRKRGDPDLKIAELTTLAVPRMFLQQKVNDAVRRVARDSFERNFRQQAQFLASQSKAA